MTNNGQTKLKNNVRRNNKRNPLTPTGRNDYGKISRTNVKVGISEIFRYNI